ncbi:MAG TPA: CBS domain-containing protein [Clostridia bacterium]|nr:CBS domain-containing protein [Clostridia bacterium]
MATIHELVRGREVYYVQADDKVLDAARYMSGHNIGAVPVVQSGTLVGVFSERDIMTRVLIEARDPSQISVAEVMTPDPRIVGTDELVDRCMLVMKQYGFRHLPVVDNGKLVGFLSMRDLLLHDLDEKDVEVRMMRAYMNNGAE